MSKTMTFQVLVWGDDIPHGIYPTVVDAEHDLAWASPADRQRLRIVQLQEVVTCADCRFGAPAGYNIYCEAPAGPTRGQYIMQPWHCASGERRA